MRDTMSRQCQFWNVLARLNHDRQRRRITAPIKERVVRRAGVVAGITLMHFPALCISACSGGSSGSGLPPPQQSKVAPSTYTVQVVASDGTLRLTLPITLVVQ
jgi:hypothetical protein